MTISAVLDNPATVRYLAGMDQTPDPYAPWWEGLRRGDESPAPYSEIAAELEVSDRTVAREAARRGLTRPRGRPPGERRVQVASLEVPESEADTVRAALDRGAALAEASGRGPWVLQVALREATRLGLRAAWVDETAPAPTGEGWQAMRARRAEARLRTALERLTEAVADQVVYGPRAAEAPPRVIEALALARRALSSRPDDAGGEG